MVVAGFLDLADDLSGEQIRADGPPPRAAAGRIEHSEHVLNGVDEMGIGTGACGKSVVVGLQPRDDGCSRLCAIAGTGKTLRRDHGAQETGLTLEDPVQVASTGNPPPIALLVGQEHVDWAPVCGEGRIDLGE